MSSYLHDPTCEQYRHLPVGDMNKCCACVTAVGARTEGWYTARASIANAADRLPLTDEEKVTVQMVLKLAENITPNDFFHPSVKSVLREREELLRQHPENRTPTGDCVLCGSQPDSLRARELELEVATLRTVIAAMSYDGDIEALIEVTRRADAQAHKLGYEESHGDCSQVVIPLEEAAQDVARALRAAASHADGSGAAIPGETLTELADMLDDAVGKERAARGNLL